MPLSFTIYLFIFENLFKSHASVNQKLSLKHVEKSRHITQTHLVIKPLIESITSGFPEPSDVILCKAALLLLLLSESYLVGIFHSLFISDVHAEVI